MSAWATTPCPSGCSAWPARAMRSAPRRACRRPCSASSTRACSRPTARRPRPGCRLRTAAARRWWPQATRSAAMPASTRCRRCWWPRCCSSRTVSCSTRPSRSATRRWTGAASSRRCSTGPGNRWMRHTPVPVAARWPRRSRSTTIRPRAAPTRRRPSCARWPRRRCAPTWTAPTPCRGAGRSCWTT